MTSLSSDRGLSVAAAQLASAVVAVSHCCCQLGAVAVVGVVAGLRSLLDTGHGGGRSLGDDGAPLAQACLTLEHALNVLIACCLLKLCAVHAVAESINDPDPGRCRRFLCGR